MKPSQEKRMETGTREEKLSLKMRKRFVWTLARSRICETLATAFATCGKNRRRPLRSRPFGMNSQAGQNSHNPLRLAEIAPFDAVNRKHA